MGSHLLMENPFGLITFVVGPAILTNATCALIASMVTRSVHAPDMVRELEAELVRRPEADHNRLLSEAGRVGVQAALLFAGLRRFYLAPECFSAATLITLLGALSSQFGEEIILPALVCAGLLLGGMGVSGLIAGSRSLIETTHLSPRKMSERATSIKAFCAQFRPLHQTIKSDPTDQTKPSP